MADLPLPPKRGRKATKVPKGPSPRAYARANPNAAFKRTASPSAKPPMPKPTQAPPMGPRPAPNAPQSASVSTRPQAQPVQSSRAVRIAAPSPSLKRGPATNVGIPENGITPYRPYPVAKTTKRAVR